jgi:hypothetical protein
MAGIIYDERTVSYAVGVESPTVGVEMDAVFKECCYIHNVFASPISTESYKNDYSSFYHQRQLSNETCDYFLFRHENATEYPLINSDYGVFYDFDSLANKNLKGYTVQWKKVLQTLGVGSYKIIKRFSFSGITSEETSFTFTLNNFSNALADKTVRFDVGMNGLLEKSKVDFTGVNWSHSIRVPAFFGRREPKYEEDNLIDRNYKSTQISMKQTNEYKFQTNLIPDCITNEIIDFVLFADDICINDYNLNNHSYNFIKFAVKFTNNDGTGYSSTSRKARLNLTFSDKFINNNKRNYL